MSWITDNLNTLLIGLLANFTSTLTIYIINAKIHPSPAKVSRRVRLWRLLGILISSLVSTVVIVGIVSHRGGLTRRADPGFSGFRGCAPINDYGVHWDVFNDNPDNGNSNMTMEAHHHTDDRQGCYAVLSFYLGDKSTSAPYCGVFSWFAPKPFESRDISYFHGFKLKAWHEGGYPKGVRAYVQISPSALIRSYDGYFEYDFTEQVRRNQDQVEITAPFEEFRPSTQTNSQGLHELDETLRSRVYQVSIVIQGEKGIVSQGKIGIDDLKFY